MCGIAGIIDLSGKNLGEEYLAHVKAMTDVMAHRGPDGEGQWLHGPAALGHRRLSIIDIAGGAQPMMDALQRYCIVFNGEIYNFRELRQELADMGAKFLTSSDTEVILQAYAQWGTSCLDRLEGMFAFALWDIAEKRLFCARDHFGKKPFYYTIQNGFFAFASELRSLALLRKILPQFSFTPSPHSIMRYLAYEYVPVPATIYAEAQSLEPSQALIEEEGELKTWQYWDLPMPLDKAPAPEDELCVQLQVLLEKATARRMISEVPLGVFLSGGIDSSIVAGIMAGLSSTPIQTFSIGFEESSYDESRYARLVSRAFATDHHERILSVKACAENLPDIVRNMDTPMADASCAPTWLLSALARENVTVALGGDGADELWAGYEHYIGYKLALLYNRLPKFLREKLIPGLCSLLPSSSGYINPKLAVATFLAGAAAPDWLRVETMLMANTPGIQREILNPEWLAAVGSDFLLPENIFAPTKKQYEHWQCQASPLARAFHVYCRQFLLDDILVKVDRCSMLHSLEVRSPFLDKHVAEFAARLPIPCKLRGFKRKYLLKKAFSRLLPPDILKRNKRGFQIPVASWLRTGLKPLLMEMAAPNFLGRQGIFNPDGIRKLIKIHIDGEADLRKPLWTFLVFQLWWDANEGG